MAYIGRQAGQLGNYIRCNTITPDGSTTTFALTNVLDSTAVAPGSENNVLCSVSGVMQAPGSGNSFTIDGTNIVFSEAPDSTDTVDFVIVIGTALSIGTPSNGTVGMSELSATGTKDATTFLRGDNSFATVQVNGTDIDFQGNDPQDAGYVGYRSPDDSIVKSIAVTVASKTTEHYHHGTGSSNGYVLDGHESPALTLAPGKYKFDQSDSSNSGHPLLFYREADKSTSYTSNITTSGTPGSSGAHTTITISKETPSTLYYQCSAHANMGGVLSNIGSESPTIKLPDNDVAYFGAGSDLQILHDGSSSVVKDVTGNQLYFQSTNFNVSNSSGLKHIYANNGYGVTIYYQDAAKIETTTTGVDVTGEVKADKAYIAEATLTDQATIAWDMATESVCKVTLAGNRTMAAPSNGSTGQFASILVIQDGTGSRTITWNGIYEFASDTAPTLTTTASLGDLFTFRYNGSKWLEVGRNQALTLS